MIHRISSDSVDIIDPLLTKMKERMGDNALPPNFVDQLKTSVSGGKSFLYGASDDGGELLGIGLWGDVSKRITLVFVIDNPEIERKLVQEIFDKHSKECDTVMAAGAWVTAAISEQLVNIGFDKLDRAQMTLPREQIEAIDDIELPIDMKYEVYNEKLRDEVSRLVFKANDEHIDQLVFPNFFGSVEACVNLIENIEKSVYGEYKEPYSWILMNKNSLVGACFMTIRNEGKVGYIPDIAIDPAYQGKGLGKAILIHSMKMLLQGEQKMEAIDLDVTLRNNARFLYTSLGFETVREYSVYAWKKN